MFIFEESTHIFIAAIKSVVVKRKKTFNLSLHWSRDLDVLIASSHTFSLLSYKVRLVESSKQRRVAMEST